MTEAGESTLARPRVWPLATAARRDFGRAFQLCRPVFTGTFVFVAGFNLLSSAIEKVFEPNSGQTGLLVPWVFAAGEYAIPVTIYIVVARLALTVHRLVLLDDASPSWSALRTPFARTFVTWFVVIAVGRDAITELPRIMDRIWVTIVIALAAYFAILRVVLIFPAIAVSEPAASAAERLRRSWSRTKDLWWVIFFAELLTALPVLLAVLLPYLVVVVILVNIDIAFAETARLWVEPVLGAFATVVSIAIAAAVASHAYRSVAPKTPAAS